MSRSIYSSIGTRQTAQIEPILGREQEQVKNNAGGYVFAVDKWQQLMRFLIMGSEGGTYYVSPKALTVEAAKATIACIKEDGIRAAKTIIEVSDKGLAAKNDPAIFALALAASVGDLQTRSYALNNLGKVARIPTDLFHFTSYVQNMRGYGRGLKNALGNWYLNPKVEDLAYHVVKYQQRDGFSNRDLLRLAHPKTDDPTRNTIFKWITKGTDGFECLDELPSVIEAFERAKKATIPELVRLIQDHNLSREMLPTESLKDARIWEALLQKMPPTAMIRNLGNMSKVGLLAPLSAASNLVVEKLGNQAAFKKARVHPIAILIALKQYAAGKGLKGDGVWVPVPAVCDALDTAFYDAFDNVEPTGKSTLIAVDMSGSMMGSSYLGWLGLADRDIAGTNLHPCEAAAALALACAKKEQNYYIMGFDSQFKDLGITPKMRLDQAVGKCLSKTFGSTDCALPMVWAKNNRIQVDTFIVLTDNDTYAGNIHPSQALKKYREASGRAAREAVVAMVPGQFSIADPKDSGMMDVAGFAANTPAIINQFSRGFELKA